MTVLTLAAATWQVPYKTQKPSSNLASRLDTRYRALFVLWADGKYTEAKQLAIQIANESEQCGLLSQAAKAWSMAGSCSLINLNLKDAIRYYEREGLLAERAGDSSISLLSYVNLASAYNQLGDSNTASHYALLGLALRNVPGDERSFASLKLQLAKAYSKMHRFSDAIPLYRAAAESLEDAADFRAAIIGWHTFGSDAMEAGQVGLAEAGLSRAFYLARVQRLQEPVSTLRKLARLRALQGDVKSAARLYDAAVSAPPDTTPRWLVYADRGDFRISQHDYAGAFADFREARDLVRLLRADVVPNDQGRVNLESGLSRIADGFIEAGNHLASRVASGSTRDLRIAETFDAAEQDRSMSLVALTPVPQDWRSRLPPEYWDLLSRYRSVERVAYFSENQGTAARTKAEALRVRISQIEAAAGSDRQTEDSDPLQYVRNVLRPGDVFLSFHLGKRESWLWVVNGKTAKIVLLPPRETLDTAVQKFRRSIREAQFSVPSGPKGNGEFSSTDFERQGKALYNTLFGKLPPCALRAQRWIVELDGPLYDLPFSALVVPTTVRLDGLPTYLGEKTAIQLAPGALLLRKGHSMARGTFVGIADPIYNAADPRYRGAGKKPSLTLPRLPSSTREVVGCAREYAPGRNTLLTGADANASKLLRTLERTPTVLHFATHIISSPGEFRSGLIALGLDRAGDMDLLGPMEIVSRKVEAELVVLNGCQSGQGQAVPGSGLMGLTRAWLGAGANAVLATQWDVPDGDGEALMLAFYRSIREHPDDNLAFALQRARQSLLQKDEARRNPSIWAAYFLFART